MERKQMDAEAEENSAKSDDCSVFYSCTLYFTSMIPYSIYLSIFFSAIQSFQSRSVVVREQAD